MDDACLAAFLYSKRRPRPATLPRKPTRRSWRPTWGTSLAPWPPCAWCTLESSYGRIPQHPGARETGGGQIASFLLLLLLLLPLLPQRASRHTLECPSDKKALSSCGTRALRDSTMRPVPLSFGREAPAPQERSERNPRGDVCWSQFRRVVRRRRDWQFPQCMENSTRHDRMVHEAMRSWHCC